MLRKIIITAMVVPLLVCGGCQSHAENKAAAKKRWEKAMAGIKLTLAMQQYENGKYKDAVKTVRQCISAEPDDAVAHLLYGKLLLAQGRPDKAEQELTHTVELAEKLDEAWYWLGVAAENGRDYGRAYECYSKAMSLAPITTDYILAVVDMQVALDRCEEAQNLLAGKTEALPREVSLKIASADLLLRDGQVSKAAGLYEQAMLLESDNGDIAESLGYCYIMGQRWHKAAETFEKLTYNCDDKQKKRTYLQLLCMCNMNAKRYGTAMNFYSRLGAVEKENARFWLELGQAALGAGAHKRAFACSQRALTLRPGWPDAVALRGCAQYMAGDYRAAIRSFEGLTNDEENTHFSWLMKGKCYEQLGKSRQADRAYKTAIRLKPESELAKLLTNRTGKNNRDLDSGF